MFILQLSLPLASVLLQQCLDHANSSSLIPAAKHGIVVQMMIQLIQHHTVVVLLDWLRLGANAVILLQEVAAKATEPGIVLAS